MKLIHHKQGLTWNEIALWVLVLLLLIFFLFFSGGIRDKMIETIKTFFNLRIT